MAALTRLAATIPVVFPMHPRTRARLGDALPAAPGLTITGPIGYVDFLALELRARCVLTDSGGVQEETTSLGVPCFTLRANTERPVTIAQGTNRLLGLDPEEVDRLPALLAEAEARPAPPQPEGWDGRAAERLAEIVARDLEARG
jgi:UDP-N-acetylglucosamine 2-epimerase (non-hydrolysing)